MNIRLTAIAAVSLLLRSNLGEKIDVPEKRRPSTLPKSGG
jgi:hypothetical protein